MDFYLRKLLSAYALPLPITLTLILVGLLLAWRYKKTGLTIASIGWVALFVFSLIPVSNTITHSLEKSYKPLLRVPSNVRYIVVLGGGVRVNPGIAPANTQLGSSSLSRLVEGIRLYRLMQRQGQPAKLILSGGSVFNSPRVSGVMRNTAVMLGVPRSDLILERGSKNTYQEAQLLKRTLKKRPFALVTSATHMQRSLALFRAAGTSPIPAPTQFLARSYEYIAGKHVIPSSKSLVNDDLSIHEYLGMLWAHANDQLD
jgi:uncharacterized SAM-binding protein YcdF (DUF218 family)